MEISLSKTFKFHTSTSSISQTLVLAFISSMETGKL